MSSYACVCGSLRLGSHEEWVRWELNRAACLCQFETPAVQPGAEWELTAVGLWVQIRVHSGAPALSEPVTAAVNLPLPLVPADCCWSVGTSRCKDLSSWHLVWLLSNLGPVHSCQHPQCTAPCHSGFAVCDKEIKAFLRELSLHQISGYVLDSEIQTVKLQ